MKKNHIISAVLILVVAALVGFKVYTHYNPKVETLETTPAVANSVIEKTDGTNVSTLSEQPSVKVTRETPINGTLKGVVEVGASGFNSFVVNIDKDKNWELVSKEFGESLAYEGFASTDDVKVQLRKYLAKMFEKGVSGRNAHFVISSGALKNPKTELIAKAIENMGYVVNRVNADQEGKYALKALLDAKYKDNSYVVDIGSGNTKTSWYQGERMITVETYGAKYYQDKISDKDAYDATSVIAQEVPANKRKYCFIIGGAPFKMAKESRQGNERFTQLKNPDSYSAGDDVKLKSGLVIYRAFFEKSGTDSFIFDWDANFTIGFLLTLN